MNGREDGHGKERQSTAERFEGGEGVEGGLRCEVNKSC